MNKQLRQNLLVDTTNNTINQIIVNVFKDSSILSVIWLSDPLFVYYCFDVLVALNLIKLAKEYYLIESWSF